MGSLDSSEPVDFWIHYKGTYKVLEKKLLINEEKGTGWIKIWKVILVFPMRSTTYCTNFLEIP